MWYWIERLMVFLAVVLAITNLFSKPKSSLLDLDQIERIEMQKRMDDYPGKYARIANWLEQRPEARLIYKLEDNFFRVISGDKWKLVAVLVAGIGMFKLAEKRSYGVLGLGLLLPMLVVVIKNGGLDSLGPFLVISVVNILAKNRNEV